MNNLKQKLRSQLSQLDMQLYRHLWGQLGRQLDSQLRRQLSNQLKIQTIKALEETTNE